MTAHPQQGPPPPAQVPGTAGAAGGPHRARGQLLLGALVALAVAVAVAAFFVGRGLRSPAQQAASAGPPAPSLITAPVRLTRPAARLVLRGTVIDAQQISVAQPGDLAGSLPVVTAAEQRGTSVAAGSVVAAVAGRPVIALPGALPAYRTMRFGDAGVDVSQLQHALQGLDLSVSPDRDGAYGLGTARAVAALYARDGYPPVAAPAAAAGRSHGPAPRPRRPLLLATVPLGEVTFAPSLPATLVSIARVGERLATTQAVGKIGSGRLSVRVKVNANLASFVRVGEHGHAYSDVAQKTFPVRVSALKPASGSFSHVTFVPTAAGAARFVGQSVAVHLDSQLARRRELVVPVAAVITNAAGASSVIVVEHGRRTRVPVAVGTAVEGSQTVRPLHGHALRPGEQVVVGIGAR